MKSKQILSFLLVFLITAIIFWFSLQPADVSDMQSGLFVNIAMMILHNFPSLHIDVDVLTTIIRKLAHFTEYAALGFSVSLLYLSFPKKHELSKFIYAYGFIVPMVDEFIQAFVPGRSCQVSDMFLDMGGYVVGAILVLGIKKLIKKENGK
ncbi:MAG: VanZ family protein [Erysipelotrichales bacterium]|nr:VanZ family protein [Erysipelotrichales bacterium]